MSGLPDSMDEKSRFTENMFLDISENVSVFQSQNRYYKDSLMNDPSYRQSIISSGNFNTSIFPKTKIPYKIIKDKSAREIIFRTTLGMEHFQYLTPADSIAWDLQPDTAALAGFHCQKATTSHGGRFYTAWYTTEIPVSDGPYKFCNLPGLIVEVADSKNHYSFRLTGIQSNNISFPANDDNQYVTVTRKQYMQHIKNIRENPQLMFRVADGVRIRSTGGDDLNDMLQNNVQKVKELYKKNSNTLELY
jgi:GLPGLI family protein